MVEFNRSIAIVVVIDHYQHGIPPLKTAVADAQTISQVLRIDHGYQASLLTDGQATLAVLRSLLTEKLPDYIQPDDRLLFYFAGHGLAFNGDEGPEGYLIPQDATLGKSDTYLPMTEVHNALTALHCRHFFRYDWFWLYGFVHPRSGQTYWWLLPRVNIDLFNRALADFAEHFGIGPAHRVVLVMDQAGWHTSEQVVVPEGLHLAFLPPYSPHMQPAERLWPILNEALANQVFETLDDLLKRVEQRCVQLLSLTGFISGLTQFHWWKAFQC